MLRDIYDFTKAMVLGTVAFIVLFVVPIALVLLLVSMFTGGYYG